MGLTKVTTRLANITDPSKAYEALFLVDIGATDCMAPADELERLGIPKEGKMAYVRLSGQPGTLVRVQVRGRTGLAAPRVLTLLDPDAEVALPVYGLLQAPLKVTVEAWPGT